MSIVVKSRTVEDFFANAKKIAKSIDQGEKVESQPVVISFDPDLFFKNLNPERITLLREIKSSYKPTTIKELSKKTHKNESWVSRVIRQMETFGVVKSELVPNPGHGTHKVVALANDKLILQAEL